MASERVPPARNLRFDRIFPEPVGRVHNSSGTRDPDKFAEYDLLLAKLWRADQVEVLLAVKRGGLSMAEVAEADRETGLAKSGLLASLALRRKLAAAVDAVLPEKPPCGTQRRNYYDSLHQLLRLKPFLVRKAGTAARLNESSSVKDLARVDWPRLQEWWLTEKEAGGHGRSPSNWMHLRRAVSWLMTQTLGDVHHIERRNLMGSIPTAEETPREPDLTPAEFWAITELVTEAVADALFTLVVSGMRFGEYLRCTEFNLKPGCRIQVPGNDRSGRRRKTKSAVVGIAPEYWPRVVRAIPAKRRRGAIYRGFKKAARMVGRGEITVHDLRHCFIQWGLAEGATIPAAQKGARHKDVKMTLRYAQRGEVDAMGQAVGQALTKGRKHA